MAHQQQHPDEPVHSLDTPWTPNPGWGTPPGVLNQPAPFFGQAAATSSWDGWLATGIGRVSEDGRMLNLDVIALILLHLLPDANEIPSHSGQGWMRLAPAAVRYLVNAITALRICELWGILLASTSLPSIWLMVSRRAKNAPRRLYYLNEFPWPDLDSHLDRASAVYADWNSNWRNWTKVLQGRSMPYLEAIYLRPNRDHAPAELPSCLLPLYAPNLRHATLCSPMLLKADNLDSLIVSNHDVEQLCDLFSQLHSVRHVEIHRTRFRDGIDWTRLFVRAASQERAEADPVLPGVWDTLEVLRIWCRRGDSYALTSDSPTVYTPAVTTLDVSGPILLYAPCARDVRLQHIGLPDVLRMLLGMPAVFEVTVVSMRGETWYDFNEGLPAGPIELTQLEKITLTVDAHRGTLELFASVRAPQLAELSFTCNASAPPNRLALQRAAGSLNAALAGDVQTLRSAIELARTVLWSAGYIGISRVLYDDMAATTVLNGDVFEQVPNALALLREAASSARDVALATYADGPPLHAGYRIHDIVLAALQAMALDLATIGPVRLVACVHHGAVLFDAEIGFLGNGALRTIRCGMVGPTFTSPLPAPEPELPPLDSVAYGASRVLHGLSALPVVELFVDNSGRGPFWAMRHCDEDVVALARSLARYSMVEKLFIEVSGEYAESGLLRALAHSASLPALTEISVLSPPIKEWQQPPVEHPHALPIWWDALEDALQRRHAAGLPLPLLNITGRFCLGRGWPHELKPSLAQFHATLASTESVIILAPALEWQKQMNRARRPQFARTCWLDHRRTPASSLAADVRHRISKGKRGRKTGPAANESRLLWDSMVRKGIVSSYQLALVSIEPHIDAYRTPAMAEAERHLWDEVSLAHQSLRAHARSNKEIHELYLHHVQLALLYQEAELLTMDERQSRGVAMHGAFIACGRRIKQRTFTAVFGWWSRKELMYKHGVLTVPSSVLHELFGSDVEDDSSDEDYLE
ncbi:hypothetical protein PENSPDRAFT_668024 [Peniophora sp. CONT]|nr:hypothetical protein PENSPDRAFT_668024 [Peniophora sp. CONT]